MKKLLMIIFLGLFWSGSANAERTNLNCSYLNTYYQDWGKGKFGETIVSDQVQKTINFTLIKANQKFGFETNLLYNWSWIENAKKFEDEVSEGEYKFLAKENNRYIMIKLNRFNGLLEAVSGYTNDENKYQWKESFSCKKAEQKF